MAAAIRPFGPTASGCRRPSIRDWLSYTYEVDTRRDRARRRARACAPNDARAALECLPAGESDGGRARLTGSGTQTRPRPAMRATQPGQSALLLRDVVDVLTAQGVDDAVLGAMAMSVHGVVRASLDANAVTLIRLAEADLLAKRLPAAGLSADLRRGDPEDPIAGLLAIEDLHGNRVDLRVGLAGLRREALDRARSVTFQGIGLRVLTREDVVATKLFAGGPQDIVDAAATLRADPEGPDLALLRSAVEPFGREARERLDRLLKIGLGADGGADEVTRHAARGSVPVRGTRTHARGADGVALPCN